MDRDNAVIDFKNLKKVNGHDVDEVTAIGPIVAGNESRYWLVRIVWKGRVWHPNYSMDGEFCLCQEASTEDWGWRVERDTVQVHFAFADGVQRLIESAPTTKEEQ